MAFVAYSRLRLLATHLGAPTPTSSSRQAAEPVAPGQEVGPWPARNVDDGSCGRSENYPKWMELTDLYGDRAAQQYLRAGCAVCPKHRVGNYAGLPGESGFELTFRYNTIKAPDDADRSPLQLSTVPFTYTWDGAERHPDNYLDTWDVTALLVAKQGVVLSEHYRHERTSAMRFTSWSMAKSVTSLLVGICIDRGLIASLDDTADTYVPELTGTELGSVTLRHLANMSSGVEVTHERDNPTIYPCAFCERLHQSISWRIEILTLVLDDTACHLLPNVNCSNTGGPGADVLNVVKGWNLRREPQGSTFNYTELCPITIGCVIRAVTGTTMAAFAQDVLWGPVGSEADASWCTDSKGQEFNCVNFACRLRDWARLGQLVAQRGLMNGRRVVSEAWIDELTSWGPRDQQVRYGTTPSPGTGALCDLSHVGYKCFIWHLKPDGSRPMFNGAHGQRVIIDMSTQAVVVQTAVTTETDWLSELEAMLDAAGETQVDA